MLLRIEKLEKIQKKYFHMGWSFYSTQSPPRTQIGLAILTDLCREIFRLFNRGNTCTADQKVLQN
jgi:hypothetical protein